VQSAKSAVRQVWSPAWPTAYIPEFRDIARMPAISQKLVLMTVEVGFWLI